MLSIVSLVVMFAMVAVCLAVRRLRPARIEPIAVRNRRPVQVVFWEGNVVDINSRARTVDWRRSGMPAVILQFPTRTRVPALPKPTDSSHVA